MLYEEYFCMLPVQHKWLQFLLYERRSCRNGPALCVTSVLESSRNKLLGNRGRKLYTINTKVCHRKQAKISFTHFLTSRLSFIKTVSLVTFYIPHCVLRLVSNLDPNIIFHNYGVLMLFSLSPSKCQYIGF